MSCAGLIDVNMSKILNAFLILELVEWIPSITNMMWWSFSSSIGRKALKILRERIRPNPIIMIAIVIIQSFASLGNVDMLKEKLASITDHLADIHDFPDNSYHKECCHGLLDGERSKEWLEPDGLVIQPF